MIDGVTSRPFSAVTLPTPERTTLFKEEIIQYSRKRYARARTELEKDRIPGNFLRPDLGFCRVGKHSHKKAINLVTCIRGSNLACAYVLEGADWISKTVLGIGISRDLRVLTSSAVGSLR